jgi:hypothetical protein
MLPVRVLQILLDQVQCQRRMVESTKRSGKEDGHEIRKCALHFRCVLREPGVGCIAAAAHAADLANDNVLAAGESFTVRFLMQGSAFSFYLS